ESAMAVDGVDIFRKHVEEHDLEMTQLEKGGGNSLSTQRVQFARTVEESKAVNDHRFPSIISSANGMATGGRILHHLIQRLPDERNSIVFVGFQAYGTRGAASFGRSAADPDFRNRLSRARESSRDRWFFSSRGLR